MADRDHERPGRAAVDGSGRPLPSRSTDSGTFSSFSRLCTRRRRLDPFARPMAASRSPARRRSNRATYRSTSLGSRPTRSATTSHITYVRLGSSPTDGVKFARSLDHGVTFSAPVGIAATGFVPMLAVGPGGEVYVVYIGGGTIIRLDRSLDNGVTWLPIDRNVANIQSPPPSVNGGLASNRFPTVAVDRTNGPFRGRLYVVWADGRNGDVDIYMTSSADTGTTWTAPVRVNDDYVGGGTDQVQPTVWVDDVGARPCPVSRPARGPGESQARRLPRDFDERRGLLRSEHPHLGSGIRAGGLPGRLNTWLGDYGGGVGAGGKDHIVWADGRTGDLDIYYRVVNDADFDGDGILNDGSGDGQYANAPCTGGLTLGCDDNCPGVANPTQTDSDGDARRRRVRQLPERR